MPEGRPAIPAALKRRVNVEAGHRCSIPTCRYPSVEIAHIIPWAKVKKHEFSNLLALCANCHDRNTRGEIDTKSLLLYKDLLSQTSEVQELVERRLRRLELERSGPATGFARACGEYSNRTFPIGLLSGKNFITLGVCVFVKKQMAIVPQQVLELIAEGQSERGGDPVVWEYFGMAEFKEIRREKDLVLIEVFSTAVSYQDKVKARLGDSYEMVKHLFSVEEREVKGQLIGFVGEHVGMLTNPRNTEESRPPKVFQFQDAFVSFRARAEEIGQFWLTPVPSPINYAGAPVFRADGTLLGLVVNFEEVEGDIGGRPKVVGLLEFPEFWRDDLERD